MPIVRHTPPVAPDKRFSRFSWRHDARSETGL